MKKKNLFICFVLFLILGSGVLIFSISPKNSNPVVQKAFQESNLLTEKGYTQEEIDSIYEYMSDENIHWLLENDYIDLNGYFQISNFHPENYDRYKAYEKIHPLPTQKIVTYVNLNLDHEFYSDIKEISNPDDITVLVNKYHALPSDYVPLDLVNIPSFPNLKLRSVAISDFEELLAAATLDGVSLIPYSTYRSYEYQKGLYEKYLQNDPVEVVDTYSARPGHSEHQTGLAIDIRSEEHWYNLTDQDYQWMQNHSYLYGFIIRYTKDNSHITGYKEEPWHIRYIGKDHAQKIHDLNLTLEEYEDIYLN